MSETNETKKKPFVILNEREKNTPVWLKVPGFELEFQVKRPTKSRASEVFSNSYKILKDGNTIVYNEGGTAPRTYFSYSEYSKQVDKFNMEHVINFRGNDLVDSEGKMIKFTPDNLAELLDSYGNVEVESYYKEESTGKDKKRTLSIWLLNETCDRKNFIKGDSKNLNAS